MTGGERCSVWSSTGDLKRRSGAVQVETMRQLSFPSASWARRNEHTALGNRWRVCICIRWLDLLIVKKEPYHSFFFFQRLQKCADVFVNSVSTSSKDYRIALSSHYLKSKQNLLSKLKISIMCSSIQSKLLSKNYLSEAGLIFQLILSPHSHTGCPTIKSAIGKHLELAFPNGDFQS